MRGSRDRPADGDSLHVEYPKDAEAAANVAAVRTEAPDGKHLLDFHGSARVLNDAADQAPESGVGASLLDQLIEQEWSDPLPLAGGGDPEKDLAHIGPGVPFGWPSRDAPPDGADRYLVVVQGHQAEIGVLAHPGDHGGPLRGLAEHGCKHDEERQVLRSGIANRGLNHSGNVPLGRYTPPGDSRAHEPPEADPENATTPVRSGVSVATKGDSIESCCLTL